MSKSLGRWMGAAITLGVVVLGALGVGGSKILASEVEGPDWLVALTWMASGFIGMVIGAGGCLMGITWFDTQRNRRRNNADTKNRD